MDRYLTSITIISTLSTSVLCIPDLRQINSHHEDLDPLNDDTNLTTRAQEKRTIFNPTIKNYAWARHVSFRPSGTKVLLGYSPVDLKYRPVLRPISIGHHAYHYDRPKIRFQLRKPIIHIPQVRPVLQTEWRPVPKPAVPIHVPPPSHLLTKPAKPVPHVDEVQSAHVDHLHLNPVPHLDHLHAHKVPAVHVEHVQQVPVPHLDYVHKVPHIHQVPVPHVEHVHQVPVAHVDHVHQAPLAHVDHVHQAPVPVHQVPTQQHVSHVHTVPLVHVQQSPQFVPQAQFVPSAQLFEVTRPNLGVLPLGAVFQSPVLRDVPPPQFKPSIFVPAPPVQHVHPVLPAAPPVHPVTHLHPVHPVQPVTQLRPVAPQPVASVQQLVPTPQAIGQVEYHGTTNFINLLREQAPVNAVHNLLPNHYHLQYPQIPQEPLVPDFQIQRPSVFQQEPVQVVHSGTTGLFPNQQQLPIDTQSHFQGVHQQLPQNHPGQVVQSGIFPNQQQLPLDSQSHFQDAGQNVFQQQLPQTQTQFQEHHFQSENDVQHVFPQDNYDQQLPQSISFQQQLPQNNFQHQQQNHFQQQLHESNFQQQSPQGNFQQHLSQGNLQEIDNAQQDDDQQQQNVQQDGNLNAGHFQPADQVSSVHFHRPGQFQIGDQNDVQGYFYQRPENGQGNEERGHSIRPGETDLQFPLHLPHHPGFEGTGRQFKQDESNEDSERTDRPFRPSIQLEPPYEEK